MNRAKKGFITTGLLAAGIVTWLTYVQAGVNGANYKKAQHECATDALVSLANGEEISSKGVMKMEVVENSEESDPQHRQALKALSFEATADDETYGHVTWSLDDSRPVDLTVITGNEPDKDFPATCDIIFHVIGTLGGKKYRSIKPIVMHSDHLMSFNPHINEVYELADQVDFEDMDNPGAVAFTVTKLSSTLN